MIEKIKASKAVRKISVFTAVFVLTGVLLGNAVMGFSDVDVVQAANYYNDFVTMVQAANGTQQDNLLTHADDAEAVPAVSAQLLGEYAGLEDDGQAGFVYMSDIPLSAELQEFTFDRCQELGLEYELVLAVMWRESRFQIDAVGYNSNGTRDNGIMQINDVNKGWLRDDHGITNLMDPYQNITAGTMMLAEYIENYGDEGAALMAYHYGNVGAQRKMAQGVTTSHQVKVALEQRDIYREMIGSI